MSKSSRTNRTRKAKAERPAKPYDGFPLYAHPLGYWSKKICGKIHHFGRWGRVVKGKITALPYEQAWKDALADYEEKRDALHAGRKPREDDGALIVGELCNQFLTSMLRRLETGRKMSPRTFSEYKGTTDRLVATFGAERLVDDLRPDDFSELATELAKQYGPVRRGNEVQRVRTIFKWGIDNDKITKAIRYGSEFKKPDKDELRRHRATSVKRFLTATEIKALLDKASPQVKAMILLALNCGFGNGDCAALSMQVIDLEADMIDFPRPKTGIERRCPLWPETVEAVKAVIASRPTPKDEADAELLFITKYGQRWVRAPEIDSEGEVTSTSVDSVLQEFSKLMKSCGMNGKSGLGFYSLRHTFRTVADATKDGPAIRLIMGHADGSIDAVYREHIDDERLQAVVDHVHAWLWPPKPEKPTPKKAKPKAKPKARAKKRSNRSEVETEERPSLRVYAG